MSAEEAADAQPTEQLDAQRALMRKVAQLTKVVVHLNTRNDEAEERYERMRAGFEDEIQTITQDAVLKVKAQREQLAQLLSVPLLLEDAQRLAAPWLSRRDEARNVVQALREKTADRKSKFLDHGKARLQAASTELRALAEGMRKSLAAFQEVAGRSRDELEQRDAELREKRAQELRHVASEHQRRLDDLLAAQAREVEHQKASLEQASLHAQRMHESELGTLRMQALQKRRDKAHRLEQDFSEARRTLEQLSAHAAFELDQLRRDAADTEASCAGMQQQVDAMRGALEEMRRRVEQAEVDASRVGDEAMEKEAEVSNLQAEVTRLRARQRAATAASGETPASAGTTPGKTAAAELAEELRGAVGGARQLEAELEKSDMELADLEEELTEIEKHLEILDVEVQEERGRKEHLQACFQERQRELRELKG